ncbi:MULTISPECIES: energy coupling factor transporter S component ThiW [Planococcus]|uniref:Energy coupling factor transporter S component ThiW n=1 Tax=Planococcus faecalis TaxID=1598147 RepID=A0ABN4XSD7_9BACL|nr:MULTISPECIES: energy coupling factor transporter S component ThiW [Planococcus]AQU80620.1 energy coupling factor transporter S component ThiW [Planococcus faecalis]MDJ0330084.1 energy coupling factor transporter S component ThiW [Planococcus sp. S3-L1]OHX55622.1 energy coupling factor transporter S component ThiW [Planococcus faecalis]
MTTKKMVVMAMFVAIGVAGSAFVYFPAGIARAYPIQHAVNVIAAVLLGPGPAVLIAFMTGVIRVLTGTGSLLAFPGGMIGACLAGIMYAKFGKIWLAALGEVVGTGLIASLVAVPYAQLFLGTEFGALFFMPPFFISSLSGAVLGVVLATRLMKAQTPKAWQ